MRIFIAIVVLVGLNNSCSTKKQVQSQGTCPCNRLELCSFYFKMESYLIDKGLLGNDKDYYKLIKAVEKKEIIINPLDIWIENFDPNSSLLIDQSQFMRCLDSLHSQNPKLYSDSRDIIRDFILSGLGIQLDSSILYRASLNIDLHPANRIALQRYLWIAILQMDAIRLNENLSQRSVSRVGDSARNETRKE
jgi:hypothetical protein